MYRESKENGQRYVTRLLFWWRRIHLPGMDVRGCRRLPRRNVLIAGTAEVVPRSLTSTGAGANQEDGLSFHRAREGPSGRQVERETGMTSSYHLGIARRIAKSCRFAPANPDAGRHPSPISDFTASLDRLCISFCLPCFHSAALQ